MTTPLQHAELTETIIGAFYYVYNRLGYGFLESVYKAALTRVLEKRGLEVQREVLVPIYLDGEIIARHRMDLLIVQTVIVEVKAGERLAEIGPVQLYNYLAATTFEVGLFFHFGKRPSVIRRSYPNCSKAMLRP